LLPLLMLLLTLQQPLVSGAQRGLLCLLLRVLLLSQQLGVVALLLLSNR
jgi:hypothetical protein